MYENIISIQLFYLCSIDKSIWGFYMIFEVFFWRWRQCLNSSYSESKFDVSHHNFKWLKLLFGRVKPPLVPLCFSLWMACTRPKTTAARVVLPLRPFFPLSAIPLLAIWRLLVLMKYVRTRPFLSLTPLMYISPRSSSTKPQSARILRVASGTWILPLTPVLLPNSLSCPRYHTGVWWHRWPQQQQGHGQFLGGILTLLLLYTHCYCHKL